MLVVLRPRSCNILVSLILCVEVEQFMLLPTSHVHRVGIKYLAAFFFASPTPRPTPSAMPSTARITSTIHPTHIALLQRPVPDDLNGLFCLTSLNFSPFGPVIFSYTSGGGTESSCAQRL